MPINDKKEVVCINHPEQVLKKVLGGLRKIDTKTIDDVATYLDDDMPVTYFVCTECRYTEIYAGFPGDNVVVKEQNPN